VPWAAYCLEVALSGPYRALQPKRVEQCAEEASGGDGNGGAFEYRILKVAFELVYRCEPADTTFDRGTSQHNRKLRSADEQVLETWVVKVFLCVLVTRFL
jgi:hypothetical protein